MAGKAKNVSFHQFPRDELLAQRWNIILKRGKPYTKYSKVCSRHFLPEDYTVTNVSRQKGHWRTLRKDAVPSQNLPSDGPHPVHDIHRLGLVDHRQQLVQAVYLQTMLAVHAASMQAARLRDEENADTSYTENADENQARSITPTDLTLRSYKCEECLKCFMDPDVLKLHMRTHWRLNSLLIHGNQDDRRWHNTPVDEGGDKNEEDFYKSDNETKMTDGKGEDGVNWCKSMKTSKGYESPECFSDDDKVSYESSDHGHNKGFNLNASNLVLVRREVNCQSKVCYNGDNTEWNESLVSEYETPNYSHVPNGCKAILEVKSAKNIYSYDSGDSNGHKPQVNSNNSTDKKSMEESLMHPKEESKKKIYSNSESSLHHTESKLDKEIYKNETEFGESQWHKALLDRAKRHESPTCHSDSTSENGVKDLTVHNGDVTHWIESHGVVASSTESNGVG